MHFPKKEATFFYSMVYNCCIPFTNIFAVAFHILGECVCATAVNYIVLIYIKFSQNVYTFSILLQEKQQTKQNKTFMKNDKKIRNSK